MDLNMNCKRKRKGMAAHPTPSSGNEDEQLLGERNSYDDKNKANRSKWTNEKTSHEFGLISVMLTSCYWFVVMDWQMLIDVVYVYLLHSCKCISFDVERFQRIFIHDWVELSVIDLHEVGSICIDVDAADFVQFTDLVFVLVLNVIDRCWTVWFTFCVAVFNVVHSIWTDCYQV